MLKISAAHQPFRVELSQSVHWHTCFYIAALYSFLSLEFCQQQSCSDRIFTLNTNIWLQLFCLKRLGHCVSLNCWKYWKLSGPHWGAFHPYPPDWSWVLPQKLSHWFCRQNILFSSGIAFGSNCQISSRGLNLDSNLNSASWPKKLWRFDLLLIYWINCQDFVFFLGLVKMQKLRQEKWLFQCSSPRLP